MPSRAALDKWASQELDLVGYNNPDGGGANVSGPGAPTNLVATPASLAVSIAFTKGPAGASPIITYHFSVDGGAWVPRLTGTTGSPVVITGLTAGAHSFRLRAINTQGGGDPSAPVAATILP